MTKKIYITPAINVVQIESTDVLASISGWTPDGDKGNGFGVVEEGKNGSYDDDSFGAKENIYDTWD